jgi:monoamine oxidase
MADSDSPKSALGQHRPGDFSAMPETDLARRGPRKRIIVIGAGLAGLSAAYRLRQADHDVTVVEARDRSGGRVRTVREPFPDSLYAEAGALFIPRYHNLTIGYARRFKLKLDPIPPDLPGRTICFLKSTHVPSPNDPAATWPVKLRENEHCRVDLGGLILGGLMGLWELYILPTVVAIQDHARFESVNSEQLAKYDELSFREFLENQGASPAAIEILRLGYFDLWGDGIESVSALTLLRDIALNGLPPHFKLPPAVCGPAKPRSAVRPAAESNAGSAGQESDALTFAISGGNDQLPSAFEQQLKGRVRFNSPVVRIEPGADQVGLVCGRPGATERLVGDRVICTIPFSVLRDVEIEPAFTPEKSKAIAELAYTSVCRVFVQTGKREWKPARPFEGQNELPIGTASTDLPSMFVHDATVIQKSTRGIIESFTAGAHARNLDGMAEEERVAYTQKYVSQVYPGLTGQLKGGASKSWDEDPWSRGGYCYFRPGEMARLLPHIERPENRVHFAGDHTSVAPGWMEGALESGHRAAQEVNDAE